MNGIKKIVNKVIDYSLYSKFGPHNYPERFKYIVKYNKKNKTDLKKKFKKSQSFKIEKIKLASKHISLSSQNFWKNLEFSDNEDRSYIHRWSWALNLIFTKTQSDKKTKKKYINSVINDWFFTYHNKKFNIEEIEWYPYNISERISNYVLLCELKIIKNNRYFNEHLTDQIYFLSKNMEFYRNKDSNHILNNARAIFLLSCKIDNKIYKNFSIELIIFLCKKFIDKDGFFKFGSSHYQLIFTKWLGEIYYFGKKYKVNKITYLKKYFDKSLCACNFFIQKNKNKKFTYPLFGNISPDFTPDFLLDYLNIKSKKNNFLINSKILNKKIKNNKEWIKLQNKSQTIFFRNPSINGFDFNHAHSDFFHFVNYYKGNPVFIDIGRKDYLKSNLDYSFGEAHNTIIINRSGIFDKFIKKTFFNKIGLGDFDRKNYKVIKKNNKVVFKGLLKNKSIIIRSFELQTDSIVIENTFKNVIHANTIDIPLFLDSKINIKKIDKKKILLSTRLFKSSINIISKNANSKIEIFKKKNYKFSQCKSYGETKNLNLINLNFSGKSNFKTIIKINFTN